MAPLAPMSTTTTFKPPKKSWFQLSRGGPFERTIQQQLTGLRPAIDEVRTMRARGQHPTVLDIACAEGIIGMELAKAGAVKVHGVELVPQRVADAKRLAADLPCTYEVGDVSQYRPTASYDIVLLLSILHKLPDPSATLRRIVGLACERMAVIRLPPAQDGRPGYVVHDRRSQWQPHDLNAVLVDLRFQLEEETTGPLGEWVGYWRLKP